MMVVFLPWCSVKREYTADGIRLLPYSATAPINGMDSSEREAINKLLAIYRDLRGKPVRQAALIQYRNRPLTADLNEAEWEEVSERVELICFAALANRDLLGEFGFYCNRDHFTCYIQKFAEIPPKRVAFESPRGRGTGTYSSFYSLDELIITVPEHVPLNQKGIELDEALLKALLNLRTKLGLGKEWDRWLAAVECFNWANTDRIHFPYAVEWVLMCGAFQQVLDAESKADDVAEKFAAVLQPSQEDNPSGGFKRSSNKFKKGLPLRQKWMREFYRLRGNLAHGWLRPKQPDVAWTKGEHLTLARLAFPLVVKALLEREGLYQLTQEDKTRLSAFEKLAGAPFLDSLKAAGEDQESAVEKIWERRFLNITITITTRRSIRVFQEILSQGGERENQDG
ncbi:hypothetical protein [Thermodesulfitimonas sp.]